MSKPPVCVDLDGVLAHYDGWKGIQHFGEPFADAADFTKKLSEVAHIIIHTTRCNAEKNGDNVDDLKKYVKNWLDKNNITYDEIYTGQGKPYAKAYIDDRAINCNGDNYGHVLSKIGDFF